MSESLKRIVAPVRHLRKYKNLFWRWVDKIERAHLWHQTTDLYGVHEPVNLHSMVIMSKKNTMLGTVKVSEEFHAQFVAWTEELEKIQLIPDTLKLHKITHIDLLEPRLYYLKKMSCPPEGYLSSIDVLDFAENIAECSTEGTDISNRDTESPEHLISMRKNEPFKKNLIGVNRKCLLHSLTGVNIPTSPTEDPPQTEPTNPAYEVPPSFSLRYSSHCKAKVHTSINLTQKASVESFGTGLGSSPPVKLADLKFPYRGDPSETIMRTSMELVVAKLSLYPEAWLVKHFFVSPWEMFNFGEDTIGNFVIAPNFLKGVDTFPSLDLFLWCGEPDKPTFYAFPIVRDQNGFFVNESADIFSSLAALVAHYSFNFTEDLPVLLKLPFLTDLVPSLISPSNLNLQESYLIHLLECTTENWLTHGVVDSKTFEKALSGAFKIQENLSQGSAKLFINAGNQDEPNLESYEISAYFDGIGISGSDTHFPTLASLISHYCCWDSKDIACCLQYPPPLTDRGTADRMLDISNMVEEVYIARALALNPQSWYGKETDPNDYDLRVKLIEQPIGNFVVTEFRNGSTLLVHHGDQNSPIISFRIEEIDSSFSIQGLSNNFPSIPLLMGYLCRNHSGLLATLLSISSTVSESPNKLLSPKNSLPFEQTQEEFSESNIGRRSMELNKMHRSSFYGSHSKKQILDKMQYFVSILSRNLNAWRFSEIPEAMKRVRQLEFRSFVVTPSNSLDQHILLIRSREANPEVVEMFTIYESDTGACGLEKEKFLFSSLDLLLAQSCCVKVDGLPFILKFSPQ